MREGWQRLKYIVDINARDLDEDTDPTCEFRYADIGSVGRGALLAEPEPMAFADAPSRARRLVRSGDTIVSTVRTYLGAVWPVKGDTDDMVVSTGFAVLTPRRGLDARYLGWIAQSDLVIDEIVARSVGVSYPAINGLEIGDVAVPVPPVPAQRRIADYLDAETARIDRIIDSMAQRADLLELRKRAAVSTALRSVATATVTVRRVVDLVTSGPRGWSDLVVDSGSSLFLRIANVPRDSISLRLDDVAFIEPPSAAEADRCRVRPGDVLTTITAAIGQVGVVPAGLGEAYVSQHLALVRPEPSRVVPEWLALALWTDDAQRQLDAARYGGTKQQLALDDIRDIRIPWAPLPTQRTTVGRVLPSLAALTEASTQTRRAVALLQERRQALITAAVTGQIEIPGVAA